MYTQKDFDKVVKGLESSKKQIHCRLKLTEDGKIIAICGWDYPDQLFHLISDVGEKLGIDIEIMADCSGYKFKSNARIGKGPQEYERQY